jgi:hypothetical protein
MSGKAFANGQNGNMEAVTWIEWSNAPLMVGKYI